MSTFIPCYSESLSVYICTSVTPNLKIQINTNVISQELHILSMAKQELVISDGDILQSFSFIENDLTGEKQIWKLPS